MSNILDRYFTDVSRHKLLTREEEVFLSQRIEKGDSLARDKMIQSNLRLAISIAKRYQKSGCSLEDLIQESNIGLMKAVEKFDWRKGFKFSTYASWWIRQSVCRHINSHRSSIKIPAHASSLGWKISRLMKEYEEEFSQKPTVPEISSLLGVSEQMVKASMESLKFQNMISIDASIGNESGNRLISETIPDNCQKSLDEMIDHKKMLNVIKKCLSSLSDREEQILRLRFGITEDFSNSEDFNMSSSELSEIIIKGEKNVDA